MASYYTVVQYVPDPLAGERINIGVFAYGEGRILCRFLQNWNRVRAFGGEDIQFLLDFTERAKSFTAEQVKKMAANWNHSIQLTEPRGWLTSPEDLLAEVAGLFLRET